MFDFVYKHKRALQLTLALVIIPPFAFFGVDSYLRGGDSTATIATVNGHAVSQQEFNVALRERQEFMQNMGGGKIDPALLDNPEMRFSIAESLVNQQLMLQHANRTRLVVTDQQLQALLGQAPTFQAEGKFSMALYEGFLKTRNKTAAEFERDLRRDLVLRQVNEAYGDSTFLPRTAVQQLARLMETQREASIYTFQPGSFEAKVSVDGDASKKYYDSRQDEFRIPEQIRVEYVMLSIDALLPHQKIDPEDVKKVFDDQVKRVQIQEQRKASHILIAVDAKASVEEKQKAQAKADDLLRQVKAKPTTFAEIAKVHSQDPGSAVNGGDLGNFKRADMVKPFSDAAFNMKVGDISGVVTSEFGLHIIKLTGISATKAPTFEAARGQIETDLKRTLASKAFATLAEQFNNTVFEQSDNLKGAATLAKTTVQQSGWFGRAGGDSDPRLNHPKLLQAIFSNEVLKDKRNTEAIETASGSLVSARLLEHKPSLVRPFGDVKVDIVNKLIRQRATQYAAQEGRAALEKLRQGKDASLIWEAPNRVSFSSQVKGWDDEVRRQILRTDVSKLPAYTGIETAAGYTLIRITRTVEPEKIDVEKEKHLSTTLHQAQSQEQNAAFLASLRQKGDVQIRKDALGEKKEK